MRAMQTTVLLLAAFPIHHAAMAQQTPMRFPGLAPEPPALTRVAPDLWRLAGTDPGSGIRYVRLLLFATPTSSPSAPGRRPLAEDRTTGAPAKSIDLKLSSDQISPASPDLSGPTLTAQCTADAAGKLYFELFANFGDVADPAFYPPWRPSGADDLFPAPTGKVQLTLDFLGYTHVKPFRRTFERVAAPGPAQLRYLNPGRQSPNLEPPGWFFQYLRSLPTLRLTSPGPPPRSADFLTTGWLAQLHAEPLCGASGA